jgi:hypothetical protein
MGSFSPYYREIIENARRKPKVKCERCKYTPHFACYFEDEELRELHNKEGYCWFDNEARAGSINLLKRPICPYWVSIEDNRIELIDKEKFIVRPSVIKPCPFLEDTICYDALQKFCTQNAGTCGHSRIIDFKEGISKKEFDELRKSADLSYYDLGCLLNISGTWISRLVHEGLRGEKLGLFWNKVCEIHKRSKEKPLPPNFVKKKNDVGL